MKTPSLNLRTLIGLCIAVITMVVAIPESRAQSQNPIAPLVVPPSVVPPHLSSAKRKFFENNPAAWSEFLSTLPRRPAGPPQATTPRALAPTGGTWQSPCCTTFYPSNPRLLTDGTVIANVGNGNWYKLTPDITGSYVNGTWSQIATLPVINGTQYAPSYYASAVLPDGRVILMGGEYNNGVEDDTTMGAIYDPIANAWTAVSPPSGWTSIGDAPNVVLSNGELLLSSCCSDVYALLDPTTLKWISTGNLSFYPNEQGYELLPNGNVLTIDIWDNANGGTTDTWQYVPASSKWITSTHTPVGLSDCDWEIGPAVLRADGTLVAFGGKQGCKGGQTTDPTAIYDSTNGTWSAGPDIPAVCGTNGTTNCTLADAPGALLPNGNILFAASAVSGAPIHMFEFTTANTINQVADPVYCGNAEASYELNFLVLPNGQILATDACNAPEFYTPTGSADPSWAPVIFTGPYTVSPGGTYLISGTQFNGLSQGAYYGDDVQGSTNYPLVQITNVATDHVFYARTFNHSTMSIEPSTSGSTNFTVPNNIETGPSNLVVIANGIPSVPVNISVTIEPTFTLGHNSLKFGNQYVYEASAVQTVSVANTGTVALPITSITLSGANPGQFSKTTTCGSSVAVSGTCTISLAFKPTTTGSTTATLAVDAGAETGTQSVTLTGTGVTAPYTLSPRSLAFGGVTHGTTSTAQTVTVTNTGAAALPITSITFAGANPGQFSKTTTCGSSVAISGTCTISVAFKPTATGIKTATVDVNAGGGDGTQTVALSGTGT